MRIFKTKTTDLFKIITNVFEEVGKMYSDFKISYILGLSEFKHFVEKVVFKSIPKE